MFFPAAADQSLCHVQLFGNPMDCSLPDSSVHGVSQARILEWGVISFSDTLPRVGWYFLPSLGNLPDPGIEPMSLVWQADSLPLSYLENPPPAECRINNRNVLLTVLEAGTSKISVPAWLLSCKGPCPFSFSFFIFYFIYFFKLVGG